VYGALAPVDVDAVARWSYWVIVWDAEEFGQGRFWGIGKWWRDIGCSEFADVEGWEVPGGNEQVVHGELANSSAEVSGFALPR
jgi:hypothetical protein